MATEFDASYLCFTQARCRLCQFPVHRGNLIVAAVEEGFATELKLPHSGDVWDQQLRTTFHTCFRKKCGRREEPTVCYHVDCYQLRLYSITPTFLTATEYAFTPSPDEERRRSEYIRQILACKLEQMVFGAQSLPYELWLMVARHLVRQCALHMAQSQVRTADKVGDSILDLNQSVFASYIKIDGRHYIKRLQNTPESGSGSGCCLLLPARNSKEKDMNIFVAEDHIGVRRLAFVSTRKLEEWCRNQSSVPGVWWKNISQGVMPSAIIINGDVQGLRMDFFDCNAPNTVGYSVALMGRGIAGVFSHKKGEADVQSVYEKAGSTGCYWQFMPMNEGEYLTDICRLATPPSATGHDVTGMTVREMPFLYHQG
ncbi:hypothetical protein CKAH01_13540 [Colletotrichum kahawae]|uniref:Uncharacterized protein n=1 Tax=Colletotrichum kahawae TaxID=34407 RepID=A0AAD9YP39_COLKA|nr:hypothetical protein CKAH01_13540 [Colletotrichum kahawae]